MPTPVNIPPLRFDRLDLPYHRSHSPVKPTPPVLPTQSPSKIHHQVAKNTFQSKNGPKPKPKPIGGKKIHRLQTENQPLRELLDSDKNHQEFIKTALVNIIETENQPPRELLDSDKEHQEFIETALVNIIQTESLSRKLNEKLEKVGRDQTLRSIRDLHRQILQLKRKSKIIRQE